MRGFAVLPALLLATAAFAAEGELSAGAGLEYTRGDYGTGSETKILSIPFMARYDTEAWRLKLTVPYLRITGQGDVIPGVGRTNRGQRGERTESGIGDSVLAGSYSLINDAPSKFGLDLTAKLKLPTGDQDRGLGTGSLDKTLQAEAFKSIERLTVFGTLGYTVFGDSDVVDLKNGYLYEVGASTRLDATDSVGASLYGRQPVVEGGPPQRELTLFWNRRVQKAQRLQAYFLLGLADGSPDVGVGASALFSF
jgi:hypothetical protein